MGGYIIKQCHVGTNVNLVLGSGLCLNGAFNVSSTRGTAAVVQPRGSGSVNGCLRNNTVALTPIHSLGIALFTSCHGVSTALGSSASVHAVLASNCRHASDRVTEGGGTTRAATKLIIGCSFLGFAINIGDICGRCSLPLRPCAVNSSSDRLCHVFCPTKRSF